MPPTRTTPPAPGTVIWTARIEAAIQRLERRNLSRQCAVDVVLRSEFDEIGDLARFKPKSGARRPGDTLAVQRERRRAIFEAALSGKSDDEIRREFNVCPETIKRSIEEFSR